MYNARVFQVLIGSPGDTAAERNTAERAIARWNADRSYRENVILRPLMWEYDGGRRIGRSDAQGELNWMVDHADVMFAFFNLRAGTPTPRASSGTVEEIDRALERGIPIHLYMSRADVPRSVSDQQLSDIRAIEDKYKPLGLIGFYDQSTELQEMLRADIEHDIDELAQFATPVNSQAETLTAELAPSGPSPAVTIRNGGPRAIVDLTASLLTKDTAAEIPLLLAKRFRLEAGESKSLPVVNAQGTLDARNLVLNVSWLNGRAIETATLQVAT